MRGRGGSWGRGGGGRRRDDFSTQRKGPITEEVAAYPENPLLSKAPPRLTEEQECLVALNRIMINYWKFQSPFHVEERSSKGHGIQTYSGLQKQRKFSDWNEQKSAILEYTSPFYFPEELLENKYTPPGRTGVGSSLHKLIKKRIVTSTEEGAAAEEEQQGAQDESEDVDDLQDFGGDDYAVDHYAENDSDDGGGEGRDDETF